tara:strand:+ start:345 stop:461 length:117 start_codon:yes stop_codon:yes gene_type:complete
MVAFLCESESVFKIPIDSMSDLGAMLADEPSMAEDLER